MNILLMTRYGSLGASSRLRSLQYIPYLEARGISIEICPLFSNTYLEELYSGRRAKGEVVKGYLRRVVKILKAHHFDLVVLEKELFPFLPPICERFLRVTGVPYLVDYDDAIFHRYDQHSNPWIRRFLGTKIDSVMQHSSLVVAGNKYLAERAQSAGAKRIEIIPTVVDAKRYLPLSNIEPRIPVVGWIGTPKTSRYLEPLIPVFELLKRERNVRFVAVGARAKDFAGTPIETRPWSEASEVAEIQSFDIGIMPLQDTPWERGKCGYKLIQYMGCGVPVVASPVGVNKEILNCGENGLFASDSKEWEVALRTLLQEADLRTHMGKAGRNRIESWYSIQMQAPRLYDAFIVAAKGIKGCADSTR